MKRLMIATAATALTAGTALAATTIDMLDLDENGFVSVEEAKAIFPEMQVESFNDIDVNDDNRLDAQEVQAVEAQQTFDQYEMASAPERPVIILDQDSDGFIQMADMQRAFPEFDSEDFAAIDVNDDNRVDFTEYYADEAQTIIARYYTGSVMDIAAIDANGDTFADFDEMVAAYPGFDSEDFEAIDANDDNRVSSQELYSEEAQEIVSRYGS